MSVRRVAALLAAALVLASASVGAGSAQAANVSFVHAQQQFMCTICHEPLNEARSEEATQENAVLRQFIARGDTMAELKRQMVAQYGVAVLAVPPAHGFSLLVFIVPGVVIVLGVAILVFTIPRWRRRASVLQAQSPAGAHAQISDEDAQRLDADLARRT